jgi:MFS family permease
MNAVSTSSAPSQSTDANEKFLFWACFIALVATAFGFMIRGELLDTWGREFGLNEVEKGQINGVGVWPMGVSIVLFSLVIDKIGYGRAMLFAFAAHITYAVIVISAPSLVPMFHAKHAGYWVLYVGNLIFALGNGTVEAVINPVVATMFSRQKTKWLNVLHAGWPGGLVAAGLLTIAIGTADWRLKVACIFLPVLVYGGMMLRCKFPVNERVAAGASYRDMLGEFGILGALIVLTLIIREMLGNDFGLSNTVQFAVGAVALIAFGLAARSLGRPMLIFLLLIMIPLATTEIGTDGWITSLMKPEMERLGANAAWVLVYTSFIMMILRFCAGPIVHRISPLGLLAISSAVAACGLFFLSKSAGFTILAAATIYGFGKSFFWPTMLGVVSERFPKGGALTLNATGGVGMLGVGVLGFPLIGLLQENVVREKLNPAVYQQVSTVKEGVFGQYQAVDPEKVKSLSPEESKEVTTITDEGKKSALSTMAIFPCIMLVCYLILIAYFRAKGGYQAEVLAGHAADDAKFTGGVEGPVE